MAEATAKEETSERDPLPSKKVVSLYTLPVGQKPVVRVEVDTSLIEAQKIFDIGCNALGLCTRSRRFFALFRGAEYPTKKYETKESIFVPCKSTLTIQRWSFDIVEEKAVIRTDVVAFQLIAMQIIAEIESGKLKIPKDQMKELKDRYDPEFLCYKPFVEYARTLPDYNSIFILDVQVMNEAKLRKTKLEKDSKVDLILSAKKLTITSETLELSIPWRRIRQFAEVKGSKSIQLEVFLADEKQFTWVELLSDQGTLLLQAMDEFISLIRTKTEKPAFRQPDWVNKPKVNEFSWKMFKREVFGIGKEKENEKFEAFDSIDVVNSSSSDEDGEEEEEKEGRSSKNGSMGSFRTSRTSSSSRSSSTLRNSRKSDYQ